jgi:hypothetical protein
MTSLERLIGKKKEKMMINALLLIPAFVMGYVACYVAMTYHVDQD